MTYDNSTRPHDSIANGYIRRLNLESKEMTKAAQILKSKKLGPEQLQTGEMYFTTNAGFTLFRTKEAALKEEWREQTNNLNWKEPFLVVAVERLLKDKPGSLRKFLFKVIVGEKMGWFTALEARRPFKKLEPDALEQDNSEYKPRTEYRGPTSWFLLPLKQSP